MIAFINGTADSVSDSFAVIETNGIGYQVFMPKSALFRLRSGDTVKAHTFMHVKEDGIALYGFTDAAELEMFGLLTSVPGVGPKVAVAVLDTFSPDDITNAVLADDFARLSKAQGVGKKTAQMICLRLKDKLSGGFFNAKSGADTVTGSLSGGAKNDAIDALAALGFSRSDALSAVLQTALPEMTAEEIIKAALKKLAK